MSNTKLQPIFDVRAPLGEPSHPAYTFFATTDDKWEEALRAGGVRDVIRLHLDNDYFVRDRENEEQKANENRAISLAYRLLDTPQTSYLTSFETVPTPQEAAQLAHQVEKYTALRDALAAKDTVKTPLSESDQNLLTSYRQIVDACSLARNIVGRQSGFLESIPDRVFNIGGNATHDLNAAPNVEKVRRSTFTIPRNKPFYLALRFAQPNEGQGTTDFRAEFGPFTLRIRGGQSVTISMLSPDYFSNADKQDELAAALVRLKALESESQITADNAAFIDTKEAEIDALYQRVKTEKLKRTDPEYSAIHASIDAARKAISDLKKRKARAPGATQAAIKAIQDKYFSIPETSINLNESSENFYGDEGILRLAFLPQARGMLSIICNNNQPFTLKIPDILESKAYGTVFEDTLLALKYNGGSFDFKFGWLAAVDEGEYRIPNVPIGFTLSDEEMENLVAEGDWDDSGPGCSVDFYLEPAQGFRADDPRYDFVARLSSVAENAAKIKNEYLPFLYNVRVFIQAGDLPANTTRLFSTRNIRDKWRLDNGLPYNPSFDNPVRALSYSCDDIADSKRGASLTIELNDPNATLQFPLSGFVNHMCDCSQAIFDYDAMTEAGESDVMSNGVIREAVLMNARYLADPDTGELVLDDDGNPIETEPEATDTHGPDSFWRLTVGDLWSIADDYEITTDVILDGLTLGQQWKRLLGLRGFKNLWVQFIDETGPLAGETAPQAGPGERPKKAPRKGMRLGAALRQSLDEFGVTEDDRELRGRIQNGVWTLDLPNDQMKFEFSGAAGYDGTSPVFTGASRTLDWSRWFNLFTVEGGRERKTGKKLSATLPLYDLIDQWGGPKPAPLEVREDLTTQAEVERATEIAAIKGTKSGDVRTFASMWRYPLPAIGDLGTVDGQTFELCRLQMELEGRTDSSIAVRPVTSPF